MRDGIAEVEAAHRQLDGDVGRQVLGVERRSMAVYVLTAASTSTWQERFRQAGRG